MATFGQTGNGGSSSSSSADANIANRSTEANSSPASNGILVSVQARLWLSAAGSTVAQAAIWDSSGNLLATGDEITITNTTEAELTFPFSGANAISLTAGTGYTYGVSWKDPGTPSVTWSRQATASTSFKNNVAYVTGSPQNPLGTGTVSGPIDMYVIYSTGTTLTKTQSGVANIFVPPLANQTGKARLQKTIPVTQPAILRNATNIDITQDFQGLGYAGSQRKVAHNSTGRIFAAYRTEDLSNGSTYEPYVAYSDDGGSTWTVSEVAVITTDHQRVPSIYVDTSDIIHIAWYGKDPSNTGTNQRQIKYAHSTNGGATWSSWVSVGGDVTGYTSSSLWQEHPTIIADPSNASNLYVVWEGRDSVNTSSQMIKFSKSTDGGSTWSSWVNLGPSGSRPDITLTSNGNIHVLYYDSSGTTGSVQQPWHMYSTDGGSTWSSPTVIGDTGYDSRHVSFVTDGTNLYAVWRAPNATYATPQIQYASWNGTSWGSISTVSPSAGLYQFFPQIALISGVLTAVWFETSDSASYPSESPTTGNIRMSKYISGAWTTATVVTSGGFDLYANIDRTAPYIIIETGAASPYHIQFMSYQSAATKTATQTGSARISKGISSTQSAIGRIQNTLTKTQAGKARIGQSATKTVTAVGRILNTVTSTQSATARIIALVTKTQAAKGRISKTFSATQTAITRIGVGTTNTQQGKARIAKVLTKTQAGTARISASQSRVQTSVARLAKALNTTQAGKGHIVVLVTKTQQAKGRIAILVSRAQNAVARIGDTLTYTQAGKGRIKGHPSYVPLPSVVGSPEKPVAVSSPVSAVTVASGGNGTAVNGSGTAVNVEE